jgi:hypothetical protein
MQIRSLRVIWLVASLIGIGCGGDGKGGKQGSGALGGSLDVPKVDPELCSTKGKTVQTSDLNRDNRPDVWKLYARANRGGTNVQILTCKQVDYDHNGGMDYVAIYGETGDLIAEEFDFTFDGKFDAREHYDKKSGKIFLIERDTDHDKTPDLWEKYDTAGKLESVRRDRNADGKPDVWEQYSNEMLVAILYDNNYDDRVDRREEAAAAKPTQPAPPLERDEPAEAPVEEQKGEEPPAAADPAAKKPGAAKKK